MIVTLLTRYQQLVSEKAMPPSLVKVGPSQLAAGGVSGKSGDIGDQPPLG